MRAVVIGLATAAGLLYAWRSFNAQAAAIERGDETGGWIEWLPSLDFVDTVAPTVEDWIGLGPDVQEVAAMSGEQNVAAFLAMIRSAEGTAGPAGYQTMFGGALFSSFADHPRIKQTATFSNGKTVTSTAAGAYQFLSTTWDDARNALGLLDFSPAAQDAGAVWLIRRRGALEDVRAGNFAAAVAKCAKEWASLPGSPYGQPGRTMAQVQAVYQSAGGVVVA